jgi:hypothetical protein
MSLLSKNVGGLDRILRLVVGAAFVAFALAGPETGYSWIGWLGIVPLLTALLGTCPVYSLIGLSTCPAAARRA